jgi:hypothetical protein
MPKKRKWGTKSKIFRKQKLKWEVTKQSKAEINQVKKGKWHVVYKKHTVLQMFNGLNGK